ncbi:uncharacterized protein LOC131876144 [Cryptomeria japonica]|uniref:uncharacterized protein LOC131876144 n=1 Tax=Cryptomeria japonica TaxID=3369 RepID=UPI0027D9E9F1|nr:uncharacterized protein LOC131876144 [Cryptomeria japonica]
MNRELFLALESGDVANIQRLHGQNSRVLFDVTFQEDTPLHIAAREGHLTVVEWILRVKPSLAGARNKDSNMPLHEAAKCGNRELVRILLESKKSSAYYCNMFGETALIIASRYGHVETVRLLVETRSYNDLVEMRRSFRVAAYGRYPDVAKAILQNPIEPQRFRRLLLLLIEWDTYQYVAKTILHNLIKAYKISNLSKHMVHNLYQAVHGGHLEIVEAVLNSPAWKDNLMTRPDINGMCAIHVAAMKGHWGIINEFRSRWPDSVEIRNSDHKTVLHFAVQYNQMEIVKNLLADKSPQKVAELVSRDHDDYFHDTALHLAAKNGVDPEVWHP